MQRPSSSSSSESTPDYPPDPSLNLGRARSLAGIAVRAGSLGAAFALGVLVAGGTALLPVLFPDSETAAAAAPLWRLPFFLAALAAFHFFEFYVTAAYNTPAATVDAFLLTANWPGYAIAHAAGFAECLLRVGVFRGAWPDWISRVSLAAGLAAVVVGQAVRSVAMAQAGRSFNHQVQQRRARSHALVTQGLYAHLRHPSYFGFFWWALGTQLVLGNAVCLAAYAAVLWRFFSQRIRREELLLVRFFGADYEAYRQCVGTKMPFI